MLAITTGYDTYDQVCGTIADNILSQQKQSKTLSLNNNEEAESTSYCVNVFYHVVRFSNRRGGFNATQLNTITARLNEAYNIHNVYFNTLGFDYIDNSAENSKDSQGET